MSVPRLVGRDSICLSSSSRFPLSLWERGGVREHSFRAGVSERNSRCRELIVAAFLFVVCRDKAPKARAFGALTSVFLLLLTAYYLPTPVCLLILVTSFYFSFLWQNMSRSS